MRSTFAPLPRHLRLLAAVLGLFVLSHSARAQPAPPSGSEEDAEEDAQADGDIDEDDRVASHLGAHVGAGDVHGQSWVSLVGFHRALLSGKNDVGAGVVVGLALDRFAAGPVHRLAAAPRDQAPPGPAQAMPSQLPSSLARRCVAAAWRASGIGADDAVIDAIESRARASALLPETRLRAMRLWSDATHTTTLASTDGTTFYDALGANLVLEARATWRLDRLLFAGDEPTLERLRLERQDARSRLGTRTLEALFAWVRASEDEGTTSPGSHEQREAALRTAEAQATLDVLTAGWFSQALLEELRHREP
jgi:hypothetical protein